MVMAHVSCTSDSYNSVDDMKNTGRDLTVKAVAMMQPEAVAELAPEAPWFPRPRGAAPHGPGRIPKSWNHAIGSWESNPAQPEVTVKRLHCEGMDVEQAVADGSSAVQAAIAQQAQVKMVKTNEGEMMATESTEVKDEAVWKKCAWTPEEDQMLLDLMSECGDAEKLRWSSFGEKMSCRSGKQCRERWYSHLSPDVCKDKWTEAEDAQLIKEVNKKGTRWAEITKCFPGRTQNNLKNRYNATIRKRERHARKAERKARELPNVKKKAKKAKRAKSAFVARAPAHATMGFGAPTTSVIEVAEAVGAAAAAVADASAYLQKFDMPFLAPGTIASVSRAMGVVEPPGVVLPSGTFASIAGVTPSAAPTTTPHASSVMPVATAFEINDSASHMAEGGATAEAATPWVVFSAGAETFSAATAEVVNVMEGASHLGGLGGEDESGSCSAFMAI